MANMPTYSWVKLQWLSRILVQEFLYMNAWHYTHAGKTINFDVANVTLVVQACLTCYLKWAVDAFVKFSQTAGLYNTVNTYMIVSAASY